MSVFKQTTTEASQLGSVWSIQVSKQPNYFIKKLCLDNLMKFASHVFVVMIVGS